MKKHIIALLAAVLLVGCSGDTAGPPPPDLESETASLTQTAPEGQRSEEGQGSEPSIQEETSIPVYGGQIEDGIYAITVTSSSSMFRIVDAQLTVMGEEMTAVLTLSGTGYEKLYMGTGEQALSDTDDACIYFVEDDQGRYTYRVPVVALNQELDVAAWSIRKKQWYERVLIFGSGEIPESAFHAGGAQ